MTVSQTNLQVNYAQELSVADHKTKVHFLTPTPKPDFQGDDISKPKGLPQFSDVDSDTNNPSIAYLKVLLDRFGWKELVDKHLKDPRSKSEHSLQTIITTVLANSLFLCGSQNAFHTAAGKTEEQKQNVAHFVGSESGKLPDEKTIHSVMKEIDYNDCNKILMDIFEKVRESKLFFNHPELIPDSQYHFAFDAETIHTYRPGCDHDCEKCPFCLKRTRDKAVWYNHTVLVVSFISPGGFKLPIYVYPIKAEAVKGFERSSEDNHKQECELSAFKIVTRIIRERFPKLKICLLLDSLYANGPVLDLCDELNFNYFIVREDGSMKTVGEDCDGLEKSSNHLVENHFFEAFRDVQGNFIEKTYDFFNEVDYQGRKINIIRFQEKRDSIDKSGGLKSEITRWEWVVKEQITRKNVAQKSSRARLRWEQEDQFNTAECRGFNMRHDYSRNSTAQMAWVVMLNIAIGLQHLFIYNTISVKLRKKMSIRDFMKDLFYEVRSYCRSKIDHAVNYLRNVQFRFSQIRKEKTWTKIEQSQ